MALQHQNHLNWDQAAGLPPYHTSSDSPLGALVPDAVQECDQVAVIYDPAQGAPKITVQTAAACVQTVLADGIAVAVIASASAPALSPEDVLLVARAI